MTSIRRGTQGEIVAFKCRTCDEWHKGPIQSLGADTPDFVAHMSDEEREKYLTLTSDQCILTREDRTDYLVRGCLEIPVIDGGRSSQWSFARSRNSVFP